MSTALMILHSRKPPPLTQRKPGSDPTLVTVIAEQVGRAPHTQMTEYNYRLPPILTPGYPTVERKATAIA